MNIKCNATNCKVQAHQGLCAATGRTPQDLAVAVHLPGAEATPLQTRAAGRALLFVRGSGCLQSSGDCV